MMIYISLFPNSLMQFETFYFDNSAQLRQMFIGTENSANFQLFSLFPIRARQFWEMRVTFYRSRIIKCS